MKKNHEELAAIIIGKAKPKADEDSKKDYESGEDSERLEVAMEEFKDALDKKDMKAASAALKAFVMMCADCE